MRLSLLPFLFVFGCSSSSSGTSADGASDPIAFDPPASDHSLVVLANAGAERIVQGNGSTSTSASNCTTEVVAGCKVNHCSKPGEPTPGTALDAGMITVTSKSMGDHVAVPITSGFWRLIQSGDFADGEDVQITGSGGADIPAFDIHVAVPPKLEPTTIGACAIGGATCPLTDASPIVAWTGGANTSVQVSFAPVLDTPDKTSASCVFDGGSGKGRIPAEVLAKLPAATYGVSLVGYGTKVVSGKMGVSPQRWTSKHLSTVKIGG
jgi:hypothetical protein